MELLPCDVEPDYPDSPPLCVFDVDDEKWYWQCGKWLFPMSDDALASRFQTFCLKGNITVWQSVPLYHWLGRDAETVKRTPASIPAYHWLGAEAA